MCAYPLESNQAWTISSVSIHLYACASSMLIITRSDSHASCIRVLAWVIVEFPLMCMHHVCSMQLRTYGSKASNKQSVSAVCSSIGGFIPEYSVGRITVLYHFRKNNLMPVIICKNDKHLVIHYNVIFSNMTDILSHLSYIYHQHKRPAMCHWNEMYWETYDWRN